MSHTTGSLTALNHFNGTAENHDLSTFSGAAHYVRDVAKHLPLASVLTLTCDQDTTTSSLVHKLTCRFGGATQDVSATNAGALTINNRGGRVGHGDFAALGAVADMIKLSSTYVDACRNTTQIVKSEVPTIADFSGIAYVLGYIMGTSGIHGYNYTLGQIHTMAGNNTAIELPLALGKDSAPTAAGKMVYITRASAANLSLPAQVVLTSICKGLGCAAVRDTVELNTNAGVLPAFDIDTTDALRDLFNFMAGIADRNAWFDGFMYHFSRGVSSTITVVGESHEGGWVRDMLRTGVASHSYGVLDGYLDYNHPLMLNRGGEALRALVYGVALRFAACITASDPMVLSSDGSMLPTICYNSASDFMLAPSTDADRQMYDALAALTVEEGSTLCTALDAALVAPAVQNGIAALIMNAALGSVIPGTTGANITQARLVDIIMFHINNGGLGGAVFASWLRHIGLFTGIANLTVATLTAAVAGINQVVRPDVTLSVFRDQLVTNGGARNFAKLLNATYGGSHTDNIARMFIAQYGLYEGRVMRTYNQPGDGVGAYYGSRHLSQHMLQMYNWIECTGLIPRIDVPCQVHGLSSYTDINKVTSYEGFKGGFVNETAGGVDTFSVEGSHTARHLHLYNFYRAHVKDGVALMYLRHSVEAAPIVTINTRVNNTMYEGDGDMIPMSDIGWTSSRGVVFPQASELVILAGGTEYGLMLHTVRAGQQAWAMGALTPTHLFNRLNRKDGRPTTSPPIVTYTMTPFVVYKAEEASVVLNKGALGAARRRALEKLHSWVHKRVGHQSAMLARSKHYAIMSTVTESDDGHGRMAPPAQQVLEGEDDTDSEILDADDVAAVDTAIDALNAATNALVVQQNLRHLSILREEARRVEAALAAGNAEFGTLVERNAAARKSGSRSANASGNKSSASAALSGTVNAQQQGESISEKQQSFIDSNTGDSVPVGFDHITPAQLPPTQQQVDVVPNIYNYVPTLQTTAAPAAVTTTTTTSTQSSTDGSHTGKDNTPLTKSKGNHSGKRQ